VENIDLFDLMGPSLAF